MTKAHQYFTAEETTCAELPSLLQERFAIFVGDAPRQREDGSTVLSLRWPMMILTELCSDRPGVAKMVAEVLNENAARFFPTAPGRKVEAASPEDLLAAEIIAELQRARAKFPGKNVTFAALVEEVGELATATFEENSDRVRKEAIQVAVMAMRMILDGDHCFDAWRAEKGLDHLDPAMRTATGTAA